MVQGGGGQTVPVYCAVVFSRIEATGRGDHMTFENGTKVAWAVRFTRDAGSTVAFEVGSLFNEKVVDVVNGDAELGVEERVIVRHAFRGETVYGELEMSGVEAKDNPRDVGHREDVVECGGEGIKEWGLERNGDRSIDYGVR